MKYSHRVKTCFWMKHFLDSNSAFANWKNNLGGVQLKIVIDKAVIICS